ncbi:MAG: cation diffusion facilitator family transporter [Bacillota bacterium]|nr:cation diffusion facilitator family transporter [Bacillota bacterium]
MKKFIIKKFVKNPEDVKNPKTRESYGAVAGMVGIISNIILCVFKIGTGLIFSSIAILADGINNLADASGSLITLVGFKLAGKKPDKDHPYGHGRTEYLSGLVVSVMVLAIGLSLLKTSIEKTIHPQPLEFSILTIVVLVVAIAIKLWQASFNVSIGKLIESDALIATGADSRNDVISTSAVLLSVILGKIFSINLDGPFGIVVSAFIIWSGIGLVKETIAPIMGQAPDPALVDEIAKIVCDDKDILGIHDLIVHDYGPGRLFASLHAEVDGDSNVFELHDTIDNLEVKVLEELNVMLTIHMDPVDVKDPMVAKAKEYLEEIQKEVPEIWNFHDVRVVSGPTHVNVVFDIVADYDCQYSDTELKELVGTKLAEKDSKMIAVITVDHRYA